MIFLGTTFFGGKYTLSPPPSKEEKITSVKLYDGTYDHLFLSENTSLTVEDIENGWDEYTKLDASFDKDLSAGNSAFGLKTTDHVVIRHREINTQKWITIYVKEIKSVDDFNIHIKDTYARSGVDYEYSVSSYLNGIENSYLISNVHSEFEGYYITDKDCLYGTIYNVDGCDTSRNMAAQTLNLLNSKYMTVVSNSNLDCDSGSVSGIFMKIDDDKEYNHAQSLQFRNDFKNRLANKKPLILKIDDGRIWMIRVTGNPTDSQSGHHDLRTINFEWVEIGDYNDMETLYYSGLSTVDSRWW